MKRWALFVRVSHVGLEEMGEQVPVMKMTPGKDYSAGGTQQESGETVRELKALLCPVLFLFPGAS